MGWLRWSSPTLAVEVTDAQLGWQLPPLLQRQLQLSTVSAARVHITPLPRPANEPPPATAPLEQLLLPLAMEVPFEIAQLQWGQAEQGTEEQASTATAADKPSASPLQVHGLAGQYRFDGQAHHLRIDHLALAQGQYTAQATLQGAAPMALQATVDGTLTTALPGRTEAFAATAHASLKAHWPQQPPNCSCRRVCSPAHHRQASRQAPRPKQPACAPACKPRCNPGRPSPCSKPRPPCKP